jgi:hypothetical protein
LTVGGISAAAGVPVIVVSTALVTSGVANVGLGARGIAQALMSSGSGGGGNGHSGSTPKTNEELAKKIAGGHAYDKHVIKQAEFPGISTREQFATTIRGFLDNPATISRSLSGGRTAYWNSSSGAVLIRNPAASDSGTFFIPSAGKAYFDGLK